MKKAFLILGVLGAAGVAAWMYFKPNNTTTSTGGSTGTGSGSNPTGSGTTPTANATPDATITASVSGTTATFSSPDATGYTHRWSFGDGNLSTDASPSNTYAKGGTYRVSHVLVNNNGVAASSNNTIIQIQSSDAADYNAGVDAANQAIDGFTTISDTIKNKMKSYLTKAGNTLTTAQQDIVNRALALNYPLYQILLGYADYKYKQDVGTWIPFPPATPDQGLLINISDIATKYSAKPPLSFAPDDLNCGADGGRKRARFDLTENQINDLS